MPDNEQLHYPALVLLSVDTALRQVLSNIHVCANMSCRQLNQQLLFIGQEIFLKFFFKVRSKYSPPYIGSDFRH